MSRSETIGAPLRVAVRRGWAPALVLALHAVAVVGFDSYTAYPRLDMAAHFAGGAAVAHVLAGVLAVLRRPPDTGATSLFDALLVVALTCTIAVFWEFGEYLLDHLVGTGIQRGLGDTLKDLALGMSGAAGYMAAAVASRE